MENQLSLLNKIAHVSWIPFTIDNQDYIMKSHFTEIGYTIIICDFKNLFYEDIDADNLLNRWKELNSHIEIMLLQKIVEQVQESLTKCIKNTCTSDEKLSMLNQNSSSVVLKSESFFSNIPFVWHYCLKPVANDLFYSCFIKPLLGMVYELKRRNFELSKIIRKKDEINRSNSTNYQNFCEETFQNEMNNTMDIIKSSNLFGSIFQDSLFSKIATVCQTASVPIKVEENDKTGEPCEKKVCKGEINTSNKKTPMDAKVTTMNEEIARRQELQEQLESKRQKKSKKKPLKF